MNAHHKEVADVYIEDGVVLAVGSNLKVFDSLTYYQYVGFWSCYDD